MKIFIIAGEASGDLHGSLLAKELILLQPNIQIKGWGGEKMKSAGVDIVKDYRSLAFMGFVEVLLNIRTIRKNFLEIKQQIQHFQPDKVIFIDYPGFNLRLAPWVKAQGIETHYYISPTIWAWKEKRVFTIKRYIDKMYCILPFEPQWYTKHDYSAEFVGHPLMDELDVLDNGYNHHKPFILLAPGSRKQELKRILPVFLALLPKFPQYDFIIAGAPGLLPEDYAPYLTEKRVKLVFNQTTALMKGASAGCIASGTATLEAGLRGLPIVVGYKAQPLSYHIAKSFVKLQWISLVNLILNREAVAELIQEELTRSELYLAVHKLLTEEGKQQALQIQQELIKALGGPGASKKVAQMIIKFSV